MLFAPVSEFIKPISENKALLQCKPAMPDTEMSLSLVCIVKRAVS